MKFLLAIILFAASGLAQDVPVLPLSQEDAATAKRLYEELQAAQKAWEKNRTAIAYKYEVEPAEACDPSSGLRFQIEIDGKYEQRCIRLEFANGFSFSTDFKFLVPRRESENQPTYRFVIPDGQRTAPAEERGRKL